VWYFDGMNDEISRYKILNKLKTVYRFNTAGDRHESSAEHSWGALMLADFYLTKMQSDGIKTDKTDKVVIDRLKVYELLMYHDVVEIDQVPVVQFPR